MTLPRFPVSAFLGQPVIVRPGAGLGMLCACGVPCWGFRCDRCSKRATREAFLAKWEARKLPWEAILNHLLDQIGWTSRNYDFSEERQAFLDALADDAEPEVFRQILSEGGLEEAIEDRDARRRAGANKAAAARKAYWRAQDKQVPALVLSGAEARIHAKELLGQRNRWGGLRANNGLRWGYQDQIYLQVLCIAGTDIEQAADVLARPASAVAWCAREAGMTLPASWRKLIVSTVKRRAAFPRWAPMAYPYVSAKRAENAQVIEVSRLVAEYLPGRADICQEILLALWEKRVTMDDLRKQGTQLRSFVRQFYKSNHELSGYARSLDAPLTPNSDFSLMDTLSTDDGLWQRV